MSEEWETIEIVEDNVISDPSIFRVDETDRTPHARVLSHPVDLAVRQALGLAVVENDCFYALSVSWMLLDGI